MEIYPIESEIKRYLDTVKNSKISEKNKVWIEKFYIKMILIKFHMEIYISKRNS
jgi:hypothetical protein